MCLRAMQVHGGQCVTVHSDKEKPSLCNDCARENVVRGRCVCPHSPSIARGLKFPTSKKDISEQRRKITVESRMMFAANPSFDLT